MTLVTEQNSNGGANRPKWDIKRKGVVSGSIRGQTSGCKILLSPNRNVCCRVAANIQVSIIIFSVFETL